MKRKRVEDDAPAKRNSMVEKGRKRKRLQFEKLDSNWGLGINEMESLEINEIARNRFLSSGPGLCRVGEGLKQTTIRVLSANEIFINNITKDCVDRAWELISLEILLDGWKENERYKEDDDIIPTGGLTHSEEILQVEEAGIENNTEGFEGQVTKKKL